MSSMEGLVGQWTVGSDAEITTPAFGSVVSAKNGTPTYVDGKFGNGMACTSSGDYARLTIGGGFTNADAGTIEYWWRKTTTNPNGYIGHTGDITAGTDLRVLIVAYTGDLTFQFYYGGGSVLHSHVESYTGFADGEWVHLAITWNRLGIAGGSDTSRFYVNGVAVSTSTATVASWSMPVGWYYTFGNASDGTAPISANANSYVDNLKIYQVEKTDYSDRFIEFFGGQKMRTT